MAREALTPVPIIDFIYFAELIMQPWQASIVLRIGSPDSPRISVPN
jgi:hypothetical protein